MNSPLRIPFEATNQVGPSILMPTMGKGMPEQDLLLQELAKRGVIAATPNFDFEKDDAIWDVNWDDVRLIDFSNMRDCLNKYDRYQAIISIIKAELRKQAKTGNFIKIMPGCEEISWIASKANYFGYLSERGIKTIPTTLIDPNDIHDAQRKITRYMRSSGVSKFVLKPSTAALGKGLVFIDVKGDTYKVTYPHEDNGGSTSTSEFNGGEFNFADTFLNTYFHTATSTGPDRLFLFQPYIQNHRETSAVYIDGKPHYIERTQGPKTLIAHEMYGGSDHFVENPDPEIVAFTDNVYKTLPPNIQQSAFLRIDVMKTPNEIYLSEVEGAGAIRLWLKKSDRVQEYVDMQIRLGSISMTPALAPATSSESGFDGDAPAPPTV